MPTKLVHYVLPLVPALTAIVALAVTADAQPAARWTRTGWGRAWLFVWILAGLGIAATLPAAAVRIGGPVPAAAWGAAFGAAVIAIVGAWAFLRTPAILAALAPAALAPLFFAPAIGTALPMMDMLWPSRGAAVLVAQHRTAGGPPVAIAGYHEPSLVFALGADTVLTSAEGAARHLASHRRALALIVDTDIATFREALGPLAPRARRLGTVRGINTVKGKRIVLALYRLARAEP